MLKVRSLLMFAVLALVALSTAWGAPAPEPEPGLLRVPRVYNALITTDERLLPSRAVSVSAPLLASPLAGPLGAPLVIGPAPVAAPLPPAPAIAQPAPARASVPARASAPAAASPAAPTANAAEEAKEPEGNATAAPTPKERAPLSPVAPSFLQLYNPYYAYSSYSFPSLLSYSLATHPSAPFLYFQSPLLPAAAPALAPVAPAPVAAQPADPAGRALPAGAKDEPEKDAVTVEAN